MLVKRSCWWSLFAVSGLFLVGPGCAAPPDVVAFQKATESLATAVRSGGNAVHSELIAAASADDAARFDAAWQKRDNAMGAAAEYASSLVAVVNAANSAGESARTLAQSLRTFAQVAGAIEPGSGPVVGVATDTASYIYAQVALVQASRTLSDAVTKADPIVKRLAELIVADTNDLEWIVRASAAIQHINLARDFDEPLSFRRSLVLRQSALRSKSYESLNFTEISELERVGGLLAPVESQLDPYRSRAEQIDDEERAQLALIAQARAAIAAWAESHRSLALAIRDRRPFNAESLADATIELRILVERLRALQDERRLRGPTA